MHLYKYLITLSLLFSVFICQAQDYKTLKAKVAELEAARDYTNAALYAEKAVKQAEAEYGVDNYRYGAALQKEGEMYRSAGMLQKAEVVFLQVMELDKKKYGEKEMVYAEDLNRLGRLYVDMTFYAKALPLFTQAAEIYKTQLGENASMYASSLCNIAATQFKLSKYTEAEPIFLKGIAIYKAQNEITDSYTNALNSLATLYSTMVRLEEAEYMYIASLEAIKTQKGDNSYEFAYVLGNLAYLYNDMGRHTESSEAYAKAQQIMKPFGENTLDYSHLIYGMALNFIDIGNFNEGENLLKKSLAITKSIQGETAPTYGTTLNALANSYADFGNYQDAEVLYKQAIAIIEKSLGKKHFHYAITRENLAALYTEMGRYQQAIEIYEENLIIIKTIFGEEHPEYAATLTNLANAQGLSMQWDLARKNLEKAKAIQEKTLGKKHPDYIKTIMTYGGILGLSKQYKEAIKLYDNVLADMATEQNQNVNYISIKQDRAVMYYMTDQFALAEKEFIEIQALVKQKLSDHHTLYNLSLMILGAQYYYLNNDKKAGETFKKMMDNFIAQIEQNFPAMSEEEKNAYVRYIRRYFEIYDNYAVRAGQKNPLVVGEMYNYQIFTKGLLINSSLKIRNRILSSNNPELISLYQKWLKKKEEVARYHKLSTAELQRLNIHLPKIEEQANTLEKAVSQKSELFKNNEIKKYSWLDIKNKLKPGEAAIEILQYKKIHRMLTDSSAYAALIIKANSIAPELVVFPNGTELETKYLKYYKNMIAASENGGAIDEKSYEKFWAPIAQKLSGIKKVYFSPDGVYHSINLNTLYDKSTQKYLIDILEIHQLSNTSELIGLTNLVDSKTKTAKLFGYPQYDLPYDEVKPRNPIDDFKNSVAMVSSPTVRASIGTKINELPGTKKEVEQIKNILERSQWQVNAYLSANALEEEIKKLNSPKVLHIATHGFFEPDIPTNYSNTQKEPQTKTHPLFRSGILLARASSSMNKKLNLEPSPMYIDDGILTAYEAMNLDLDNTDLVILSACETGLGDVENGEGVYGLQRAFKVAGAQSILISLWKVDDAATQKLMVAFYDNWVKTGNKREAFKLAQQALKTEYPDPHKWGAFVMIGE